MRVFVYYINKDWELIENEFNHHSRENELVIK